MTLSVFSKASSKSFFLPIQQISTRSFHSLQTHISETSRQKIQECFSTFTQSPYNYSNFDVLSLQSENVLKQHLSSKNINEILAVNTTNKGFIEITGMPEDAYLPDTPHEHSEAEKNRKSFVKEFFCMGLANLINKKIFNYRQEGWGKASLIFNIFPRRDMQALKGAGGYANDFHFHSENAWQPQGISNLFLTGVRQDHDKQAITYCVANQTLVDHLEKEEIEILKTENFRIFPPEIHFKMEKEEGILFTAKEPFIGPVLTYDSTGSVNFRINFNGMKSETENTVCKTVLKRLEELARMHSTHIRLGSHNMVVINNRRAIHTRNGYTPRFDGKDRWFQRYFLADEEVLWPSFQVKPHDFLKFLFYDQACELHTHLIRKEILDEHGNLTAKFAPHNSEFNLELPTKFEIYKMQLLKLLIQKGPARPHRVI